MKDILFIIGSDSDMRSIEPALELIKEKNFSYELHVFSAHRNLKELLAYLADESAGFKVILAAAGLSAALAGVIAAQVQNPVIGIPLVNEPLSGIDSLLSILQLPKGVPVATMGLGKQGILNAVYLADRIINLKTT